MRVSVDDAACIGSGMCTTIAPEVFRLEDDGTLTVLMDAVAADIGPRMREAAACCPVAAIHLRVS